MTSFVAAGTFSNTNGASNLSPGIPAGMVAGDLMILCVYTRESTDGSVSVPAGWTLLTNSQDSGGVLGVWWRLWQSGDAAPTVTLTNHAAGDSAGARIFGFRGVDQTTPIAQLGIPSTNGNQQNIGSIGGINLSNRPGNAVLVFGGKRSTNTGVATLSGESLTWVEDAEASIVVGNGATYVVDHAISSGGSESISAKTFTVSGGASATGRGVMLEVAAALAATSAPTRTPSYVAAALTASVYASR